MGVVADEGKTAPGTQKHTSSDVCVCVCKKRVRGMFVPLQNSPVLVAVLADALSILQTNLSADCQKSHPARNFETLFSRSK